jgi:hypothetical protein
MEADKHRRTLGAQNDLIRTPLADSVVEGVRVQIGSRILIMKAGGYVQ